MSDTIAPTPGADINSVSAKTSYVRRFDPWGWSIGTGVYMDDVAAQVRGERTGQPSVYSCPECGGVLLADALNALSAELKRVTQ